MKNQVQLKIGEKLMSILKWKVIYDTKTRHSEMADEYTLERFFAGRIRFGNRSRICRYIFR